MDQSLKAQHRWDSINSFVKNEGEFRIEIHTRGIQRQPELAALREGFVAAWTDDAWPPCEIGGPDVRAKLFNSAGGAVSHEFRVNTETIDHQRDPRIASFSDGGFVVVWQDFSSRGGDSCGSSIKAKLFNAAGVVVKDEFLVNVETSSRQFDADVTTLPSGDFVVVWQCHGGGEQRHNGVKARLFDSDGNPAGDEIPVSIRPEKSHDRPSLASLADGSFVVVWSNSYSNTSSINAKVFSADGAVVREEFLVNSRTIKELVPATVTGLAEGGFVVAWTDPGTSKDASKIWMRIFDEIGNPVSHELVAGAQAKNGQHSRPLLSPLGDGGFVLVWSERQFPGDQRSVIKALPFGPKGMAVGVEMLVSERSDSGSGNAAVIGLNEGGFVVAWEDASSTGEVDVKAQIFRPTKRELWGNCPAPA